jgi:hypothetical protein
VQSTLGTALAAQGQAAEAEKLLLAGHDDLRAMPSTPPPRIHLAVERLVHFYATNGRSEEAASWRRRLDELDASGGAARSTASRR